MADDDDLWTFGDIEVGEPFRLTGTPFDFIKIEPQAGRHPPKNCVSLKDGGAFRMEDDTPVEHRSYVMVHGRRIKWMVDDLSVGDWFCCPGSDTAWLLIPWCQVDGENYNAVSSSGELERFSGSNWAEPFEWVDVPQTSESE